MSNLKTVYVIRGCDVDDLPKSAQGLVDFFQTHLDSVPEQYKDTVEIYFSSRAYYDYGECDFDMYYIREKTESEIQEEEQVKLQKEALSLVNKRKELERLKRELGE